MKNIGEESEVDLLEAPSTELHRENVDGRNWRKCGREGSICSQCLHELKKVENKCTKI